MPAAPPGTIGAWNSSYLTKFLNDWLRRNPLPAQDQLTIKKLTVSQSATAPTPVPGDSSTSVATTAFVQNAIASGVTSVFGRVGAVAAASGDYTAAQVTNAADKSSVSNQNFSGSVVSPSFITNVVGGAYSYRNYLVSTDANPSYALYGSGTQQWGPGGANTVDTNLYRNGVGTLKTDGALQVVGGVTTYRAIDAIAFANYFAQADTQPGFQIYAQGAFTWGPGGTTAVDLEQARLVNSSGGTGTFLELIKGSGFGYGTGVGGTVTQATSLSTGVTLNKPTGTITLFTSAITAGLYSSFTVTNSVVGPNDTVVISGQGCAGLLLSVTNVAAGSFQISHYAPASVASSTKKINFAVIKGAIA